MSLTLNFPLMPIFHLTLSGSGEPVWGDAEENGSSNLHTHKSCQLSLKLVIVLCISFQDSLSLVHNQQQEAA
jgi:hypothetical protein